MNIIEYLGIGISHERSNMPCQDALGHRFSDNGNIIMVLSDGAGSARFASQAAHETVNTVMDYFDDIPLSDYSLLDKEKQKKNIINACLKRLRWLGSKVQSNMASDFSATLLFSVYDGKRLVIGHLGDGNIFCFDKYGEILFCSEHENIAGHSNRTYFISSPDAVSHLRIHIIELGNTPVDSLLMASDGVCFMFQNRGNGSEAETAKEIIKYVNDGIIHSNADLSDILNQMAEIPSERLDDWSVLLWSSSARHKESCLHIVSMLEEERAKYAEDKIQSNENSLV